MHNIIKDIHLIKQNSYIYEFEGDTLKISKNFDLYLYPIEWMFDNILTKENTNRFSKLLRFGKKNYLEYYDCIDYYHFFLCDICGTKDLFGYRYKCIFCFEIDICKSCYYNKDIKICPCCNKDKLFKYNKNSNLIKYDEI